MKSNYSETILFDMNNYIIENQKIINWDEELKDELKLFLSNENQYFLKRRGLKLNGFNLVIENQTNFILSVISILFENYKIINCEEIRNGHPDYILEKGKEKIYLEIKIDNDGLRQSQLEWFFKNKDKNIKILWINSYITFIESSSNIIEKEREIL